jgi:hypothetical protein
MLRQVVIFAPVDRSGGERAPAAVELDARDNLGHGLRFSASIKDLSDVPIEVFERSCELNDLFRARKASLQAKQWNARAPTQPSCGRRRSRASRGHAGALAFGRTGDPATGKFRDAKVIRKFGDVPDDLNEL